MVAEPAARWWKEDKRAKNVFMVNRMLTEAVGPSVTALPV